MTCNLTGRHIEKFLMSRLLDAHACILIKMSLHANIFKFITGPSTPKLTLTGPLLLVKRYNKSFNKRKNILKYTYNNTI